MKLTAAVIYVVVCAALSVTAQADDVFDCRAFTGSCENGGVCNLQDGSCTCPPEFSGVACELDGDSSEIDRCDVPDLPCEIIYCSFAAPYAPVCDDKNVTFNNLCEAQCGFRANVVCEGECPCPGDCSPK